MLDYDPSRPVTTMSELDESMLSLDKNIDAIGEYLSALEGKLQSVIRPDILEKAKMDSGACPPDNRAPLTQRISGFSQRAERHVAQICRILDRLAVS